MENRINQMTKSLNQATTEESNEDKVKIDTISPSKENKESIRRDTFSSKKSKV